MSCTKESKLSQRRDDTADAKPADTTSSTCGGVRKDAVLSTHTASADSG